MSVLDAIGRMLAGVLKAWFDGCALHASATSGHLPDPGDL